MRGTEPPGAVAKMAQLRFTPCSINQDLPGLSGERTGGHDLPKATNRLNASLERILPEKRLVLCSGNGSRFVRLRPLTQLAALGGMGLVFGWTLVATSILAIDAVSTAEARHAAEPAQTTLEQRLTELAAERDARAAEALAAQNRFAVALDQVSQMQSQLLASEEQRRELEAGLQVIQSSLGEALAERNEAGRDAAPQGEADPARHREVVAALDILTDELRQAAGERAIALQEAEAARGEVQELALEREEILARNDEILTQVEDALAISVEPLDDVFRSVGMDPDEVLSAVRSGYSGQGGPLTPLSQSTRGNADLTRTENKARQIIVTLDQVNTYRIAMEKLPLAMPVSDNFRFTSGFGPRWGRKHEGLDLAGPVGTPIHATGDGVVTFVGRMGAYGNLIKVQHELGVETRYAHLSRMRVKVGQRVSQGERIGDMGNTGRSTGPHLHYEVRMNGRAVDPMSFIKAASNVQ